MKRLRIGACQASANRPLVAVPLQVENSKEFKNVIPQFNHCAADVIEWRIDGWQNLVELETLFVPLLKEFQKPVLVTIRTVAEGGKFLYDAQQYMRLNMLAIKAGVAAIDIEVAHLSEQQNLIQLARQQQVVIIGSKHVLQPNKLTSYEQLALMSTEPIDVIKLAIMPQSQQDVKHLLMATQQIAKKVAQPLITMAMGHLGQPTRIVGFQFGSQLTFASLTQASAPGQLTLTELLNNLEH